jgi:CRISPR-associated endoribonuclease Cas6
MSTPRGFLAVVLNLQSATPADVIGDHLHGWLINQAEAVPSLADRLHTPPEEKGQRGKPFSLGFGRDNQGHWLRITSVDAELSAFLERLPVTSVTLGHQTFPCVHRFAPRQHPWTGASDSQALWAKWMQGPAPAGRVRLHFLTPTAFARGRSSTTLLPWPELVFKSLIGTWNANASAQIDEAAAAELLTHVQDESHVIRTVPPLRFKSHRLKGFVGQSEYSCGREAPERARRLLHLLAAFAFFAGVGLKRTMGMGQVVLYS